MASTNNRSLFWAVAGAVVILDLLSKLVAVAALGNSTVHILGDWFTLRLVYNPGAAFGIDIGVYSRWVFMALAIVALVVLGSMVRHTPRHQWFRLTALSLVCGGAVGNLIDRIRSPRGVVDFIDVWIWQYHWPTFNVADMAVTCGAVALAAVLWQEGRGSHDRAAEHADPAEA